MNTKLYYEYCSRVLNGEIIAGETIRRMAAVYNS